MTIKATISNLYEYRLRFNLFILFNLYNMIISSYLYTFYASDKYH